MGAPESRLAVGSRNGYEWLVCRANATDLLRLCPEVVLGRYVAVTSLDSGPVCLNDIDRAAGWEFAGGIAYSPKIQQVEMLPRDQFDEWYVFVQPANLGEAAPSPQNIFESEIEQGKVHRFVNFGGFALHAPEDADLARLFWQQLDWIHPESYMADGDYLNFVSANKQLFNAVRDAFTGAAFLMDLR